MDYFIQFRHVSLCGDCEIFMIFRSGMLVSVWSQVWCISTQGSLLRHFWPDYFILFLFVYLDRDSVPVFSSKAFHFFSASINLKPDFPSSYMRCSESEGLTEMVRAKFIPFRILLGNVEPLFDGMV